MAMDQDELGQVMDRALGDLPVPRAPRTLLPRVMAAVAERRKPWYARAWRTWPAGWQAASVTACLALFAAATFSTPAIQAWLSAHTAGIVGSAGSGLWRLLARTVDVQRAAEIVWRVVINPLASAALLPVLGMLVASMACAAALGRIAFGGTSQS